MGWRETRGAWTLALLLVLLLNLLAEPLHSTKEGISLETVISAAVVELLKAEEDMKKVEHHNQTHPKEVEFGPCTVTCGIGMREVILTNGCPVNEKKCIVRIEECKGPPDCGWGKPLAETLESVKMPCIFVPPENRFQYTWKMLIPDQQSLIIPNDSAVLEVHRDTHPVAFECDTTEDEELIASVKYTVYSTDELETRRSRKPSANAVLVFVLVTGIIICVGVLFAIIFVLFNWAAVKVFWQTKVRKSRESMSSSLVRSSSGLTPTVDLSQISQLESSSHRQASYHEWNEPLREGGGGGGGGGGTTEEERGNN
uniref:Sperm acrosome membrane-associated protein 1 n=1 Tax=Pogona vitticeps TaxID=103695 RepID=A0A6J0V552_9SAUR